MGTLAKPYKLFLWLILLAGLLAVSSNAALAQRQPNTPTESAQTALPKGDIVFVMDESGSFFNDALAVDANVNEMVKLMKGVIDYRVGIIGFGGYEGHMGTKYAGQPYVNLRLTDDMVKFSQALRTLVTQGRFEYGFNAVQQATRDEVGFRPGAGVCVVMITDEDADLSSEHLVTREGALEALREMNAVFYGVVEFGEGTTMQDYGPLEGSLAQATGGKVFDIKKFRKDPVPVLRELIYNCVGKVEEQVDQPEQPSQNGQTPADNTTTTPQPTYVTLEQLEEFRVVLTQLAQNDTDLLARLSLLLSRIEALESASAGVPNDLLARFDLIDRNFAKINVTFQNFEDRFNQYDLRLNVAEQDIASLRTSLAALQEASQNAAIRLQLLEERVGSLESSDLGDRVGSLVGFVASFDVFKSDFALLLSWRDDASQRLASLEQLYANVSDELSAVRSAIDEMAARHEAMKEMMGTQMQALMQRLTTLEASLADLAASISTRIEGLEVQLAAFDARFQEIQAQIAGLDVEAIRQELSQFGERATAWDAEIGALRDAVASLQAQIGDLAGLTARVARIEDDLAALESQLKGTEDYLTGRIQDNTDDIDALESKLLGTEDFLTGRIQDNAAAIEALKGEIAQVKSDLQGLLDRLGSSSFALQADLDSLASSLGSRIQSLLRRIQNLEAVSAAPAEETRAQLENLANLISQLQARLAEMASTQNAQYEELAGRLAGHDELLQQIQAFIALDDERTKALDGRVGTVETGLADLKAQLGANQKSLGELQKTLSGVQTQLKELSEKMSEEPGALDPARLRSAQRLAEIAFLTAVAAIGLSLLLFLSKS